MKSRSEGILSINSGSSSIKFALFQFIPTLDLLCTGSIVLLRGEAKLHYTDTVSKQEIQRSVKLSQFSEVANYLLEFLRSKIEAVDLRAIGHRIVHGMQHTEPEKITPALIEELKQISTFAPEHLPAEISLIELFLKRYPDLLQVACFDTSFHTSMPAVAKLLPLPRKFSMKGTQRFGFHGISCSYLMQELEHEAGPMVAAGKIILAHLGNGASITAVKDGKSMDTSMGFTPAAGLVMGTRTGDIDPGIAAYLMKNEGFSIEQFDHLINHESGLLGISDTTSDMGQLLLNEKSDNRAAEAISLFCYQAIKWFGAFAAVLDGVDTIVFSGGIGENAPAIRERICAGLTFLGLKIDAGCNDKNATVISSPGSKVKAYVIPTNEELMIASFVAKHIRTNIPNGHYGK